jgi:hypothetical protein
MNSICMNATERKCRGGWSRHPELDGSVLAGGSSPGSYLPRVEGPELNSATIPCYEFLNRVQVIKTSLDVIKIRFDHFSIKLWLLSFYV